VKVLNRQSLRKLEMFLNGIELRIAENAEFFKEIKVIYTSGTKNFTAILKPEENMAPEGRIFLNFNGNTETIRPSWISESLVKIAENYDKAVVTYEERGTTIIIEADNKNVRMSTRQNSSDIISDQHNDTSTIGNRDYFIKANQAGSLLKEIGILGANGKIKNDMIRKYNQIDHFVELMDPIIKELADKHDSITILDCACGKSYLSFVLNYYIKEVLKKKCWFVGLDYSSTVIEASKRIAANLGYNNMEFKLTDVRSYKKTRDIHLVISLHACDTATDEALALAVNNNVEAVVAVPCCHREVLSMYDYPPFKQILKYGILKARIADALTDGMRALFLEGMGYKTSIVEYISPLDTPKNLMIRALKAGPYNSGAMDEYKKLRDMLNVSLSLEKLVSLEKLIGHS